MRKWKASRIPRGNVILLPEELAAQVTDAYCPAPQHPVTGLREGEWYIWYRCRVQAGERAFADVSAEAALTACEAFVLARGWELKQVFIPSDYRLSWAPRGQIWPDGYRSLDYQ